MVLEANDSWYGGRPKIDRIDVRFILDANARLAAMLAGEGDFLYSTDLEQRATFAEQAVTQGRGQLIQHNVGRLQLAVIKQANPIFGGPDKVRQRQAMLHGLDREELASVVSGERGNVADSWLFKRSPKQEALKDRVATYPYNPTDALRILGDAGWARGADGRLRDGAGQPFSFEYWGADASAGAGLLAKARDGRNALRAASGVEQRSRVPSVVPSSPADGKRRQSLIYRRPFS